MVSAAVPHEQDPALQQSDANGQTAATRRLGLERGSPDAQGC